MPSPSAAQQPAVDEPDIRAIVTEDDTPVDNVYSEKQQRLLTRPLYSGWKGPPPEAGGAARTFVALANVGVFIAPRLPPMVPDVFVSLDVSLPAEVHTKAHRTYFVWEYGKVPDVVIEVVSNGEGGELTDRKKRYRQMGVPYYVVWDPEHHLGTPSLQVFKLSGHLYVRMKRAWFADVGLGLTEWTGDFEQMTDTWLRWCDAEGAVLSTGTEQALAERTRADSERTRADSERTRADAAQARAERLAARLRALGVDPEA